MIGLVPVAITSRRVSGVVALSIEKQVFTFCGGKIVLWITLKFTLKAISVAHRSYDIMLPPFVSNSQHRKEKE